MVKHICTEINFSPGLLGRLIRAYYPSLNLEEKLTKANWAFAIVTLTLEISLLDSLIHELSILKKQFKTHLFNLFKLFFLYHHSKSTMTSYALPFNTKKRVTILSFYSMYKNCNFPQMFVGDTLCLWRTLNSASTQNRQGSCSMSRDSLALSRKHTSSSSFFKVKRDSASSWPNREKVNRHSYSDNQDNFQFTKEIFLFWSQDILVLKSSLYTPKLFELFNCKWD